MPRWLDDLVDRQLRRLGYRKARSLALPTFLSDEAGGASRPFGAAWGDDGLRRLAMGSAWVYSDINLIAREISQAGMHVCRREGPAYQDLGDHPFERLLRRPNPFMSRSFLVSWTVGWLLLDGAAYWYLAPDLEGENLAEIWPLPSRQVTPVPDAEQFIAGFEYTANQRRYLIPAERACYFRLWNPFDPFRGLSPLGAAAVGLETDYHARQWNHNFFGKRNAMPTAVISLPAATSDADFARLRDEIVRDFGGAERRVMIARGGEVDVKTLSLSQKDMDFLAGREFTRDEIDRVFGVPAGLWAKDATQANALAADRTLKEKTVWPLLVYLSEEIGAQVLMPYYGDDLVLRPDDIRPVDRELQVREFLTYSRVMTVDEARAMRDLPTIGGALGGTLVPQVARETTGLQPPNIDSIPPGAALRAELRRWRSVARREVRDGHDPAARHFASEVIPPALRARIEARLAGATSEDEVRTAFAPEIGSDGSQSVA
jgi:HK97 family phage portal protein